jgi:hypothetical protein
MSNTSRTSRFVIWICSKFTRIEIEQIVTGLSDVLQNRDPEVKPKEDFNREASQLPAVRRHPIPPLAEPLFQKNSRHERLTSPKSLCTRPPRCLSSSLGKSIIPRTSSALSWPSMSPSPSRKTAAILKSVFNIKVSCPIKIWIREKSTY